MPESLPRPEGSQCRGGMIAVYPMGTPNHEELVMLPIGTILHPTDFSPHARHAFGLACALARDHGARLVLLHVKPPELMFGELYPLYPPDPADVRLALGERLRRLRPPEPAQPVEHLLREG